MTLGKAAWLTTVVVCMITALILVASAYYGYAIVVAGVAASAAINLR